MAVGDVDTDVPGDVDVDGTTALLPKPLVPGAFEFTKFDCVFVLDAMADVDPALEPGIF